MVSEWEGSALLDQAATTDLEATFVPVNCAAHSETRATQSLCEVVAAADVTFVESGTNDGGVLTVAGAPFEYLLAEFGRPVVGGDYAVTDAGDAAGPWRRRTGSWPWRGAA